MSISNGDAGLRARLGVLAVAVPMCMNLYSGAPERSSRPLGTAAKIWNLGSSKAFEVSKGLTFSSEDPALQYRFVSDTLKVLQVFSHEKDRSLVFTREARGFGFYVWDNNKGQRDKLRHVISRQLNFKDGLVTTVSPLVDAQVLDGSVYLLTNLHLMRVRLVDLLAGKFTPESWSLPVSGIGPDVWRGAGLFFSDGNLVVIRLKRALSDATLSSDLALVFHDGWGNYQFAHSPPDGYHPNYLQLLSGGGGKPTISINQTVVGEQTAISLKGYALAASFLNSRTPNSGAGIVSIHTDGTYFMEDGQVVCRLGDVSSSVLIGSGNMANGAKIFDLNWIGSDGFNWSYSIPQNRGS